MKKYLSVIMIILWVLMVLFLVNRVQKTAETKKDKQAKKAIASNDAVIGDSQKYIAQIEQLNKMLAECQRSEQYIRKTNQATRTRIIKIIDEKVSSNPTPADKELLRDIANLADLIREARRFDTIKR